MCWPTFHLENTLSPHIVFGCINCKLNTFKNIVNVLENRNGKIRKMTGNSSNVIFGIFLNSLYLRICRLWFFYTDRVSAARQRRLKHEQNIHISHIELCMCQIYTDITYKCYVAKQQQGSYWISWDNYFSDIIVLSISVYMLVRKSSVLAFSYRSLAINSVSRNTFTRNCQNPVLYYCWLFFFERQNISWHQMLNIISYNKKVTVKWRKSHQYAIVWPQNLLDVIEFFHSSHYGPSLKRPWYWLICIKVLCGPPFISLPFHQHSIFYLLLYTVKMKNTINPLRLLNGNERIKAPGIDSTERGISFFFFFDMSKNKTKRLPCFVSGFGCVGNWSRSLNYAWSMKWKTE